MTNHEPKIVNVITQNVLLDYRRTRKGLILHQDQRIDSIAATINNFPGSLDVVGVQEAHKSESQHNGEILAEACGYGPGFWVQHNVNPEPEAPGGRPDEYMGMFGALVDDISVIEIGDNRHAVMTVEDGVAYVTFHFKSGRKARYDRSEQARNLNEATKEYENLVVFGDTNEPPIWGIALARAELARTGLRSVFPLTHQRYPKTCPIPSYKAAAMNGRSRLEAHFVERGWPIDDILVRGPRVKVLAAGVLDRVIVMNEEIDDKTPASVSREGSDHDGPWARLEIVN
jgi:hypothetical protein